jgi:hypothetical protein
MDLARTADNGLGEQPFAILIVEDHALIASRIEDIARTMGACTVRHASKICPDNCCRSAALAFALSTADHRCHGGTVRHAGPYLRAFATIGEAASATAASLETMRDPPELHALTKQRLPP